MNLYKNFYKEKYPNWELIELNVVKDIAVIFYYKNEDMKKTFKVIYLEEIVEWQAERKTKIINELL